MPRVDPDSELDGYYTGVGKAGESDGGVGAVVIGGVEHFGPEFEWGDPIRASRRWKMMTPEQKRKFIKYKSNRPKKGAGAQFQQMQGQIDDLRGAVELLTRLLAQKEGISLDAKKTAKEADQEADLDDGFDAGELFSDAPWKDHRKARAADLRPQEDIEALEAAFEVPEDESLVDDADLDGFLAGEDDEGDDDLDVELARLPVRQHLAPVRHGEVREGKQALRKVSDRPERLVENAFPPDFWDGYY